MKRRSFLSGAGAAIPGAGAAQLVAAPLPQQALVRGGADTAPLAGAIRMHNGRPTLFLNDRPVYSMIYSLTDTPGGRWTWEEIPRENLENFAAAGIQLFQVDIWLAYIWRPDGALDMDLVRRQIRGMLEVKPDAAITIRLHVNAPDWWNQRHPEELAAFANGPVAGRPIRGLHRLLENDLDRTPRASLASALWRKDASGRVAEFCRRLAQMPEGARVYGIHPCCGVYHEWHYWGFIQNDPDTGPAMTTHFRTWLRARYGDDARLRKAWNDSAVTLASAAVPLMAERVHTENGIFRDPAKERKVADYFRCQQEAVADDIILFCRTAKESWGRPLVTGVFYGYFFFLFGRQQTGGHLEIQRVLASPWVDYLSAPQTYAPAFRGMGGSGQSRGLVESFTMHGKLLLDEMDQVPALYGKTGAEAEKALPESVAILRRNVAESYTRGHGMWFYDFGPGLGRKGWWDNTVLMEEIARMRRVFGQYFERPHRPQADVAVVYDTASFYYTASAPAGDPVIDPVAVNQLPIRVYQSGAVADVFHLGDLERADWDRYRVVIFANTFLLDAAQKWAIRERVVRGGRHVVWVMAPGYTDGERLDAGFIGDVTGIRVERAEISGGVTMDVRAPGLPAVEISVARGFQPVFVAADASAESLGTLRGGSRVAFARKKLDGWTSWFSSLPPANAELLRSIFQLAGVHLYGPAGDVFYSGGGILSVHSATGGTRTLKLRNGKTIETVLPPTSTVLFDNETGQKLIG